MKRTRRTPSRTTKRDVHDDLAERTVNALKDNSARSEDQVRGTSEIRVPGSLKTGAGRQYWDEVLRLLVKIRADCDAAAERLGYASTNDDGLAAVEYIANKILDAVWGERQQVEIAAVKKQPATRLPEGPKQSFADPEVKYKPGKRIQQPSHPERSKRIEELKQMLRERKTKSGAVVDPQLAHEIAKQITILNEGMAQPETTESIKQIQEMIAPFFAKLHGKQKKGSKAPAVATREKRKPVKSPPSRAKKAITRGSKRWSR